MSDNESNDDMTPGQALVVLCVSAAVVFFLIAIWVQLDVSTARKLAQTGLVFLVVGVLTGVSRLLRDV